MNIEEKHDIASLLCFESLIEAAATLWADGLGRIRWRLILVGFQFHFGIFTEMVIWKYSGKYWT